MEIQALIIPLLIGVTSSYLTYYFTLKSKRQEAMATYKEQAYANLLIEIQGFLEDVSNIETQKRFYEEMYKSWLYCSDEVVKATNDLMDLAALSTDQRADDPNGHKALGNLVIAIREDLLGKSKLDHTYFKYRKVPTSDS